MPTSALRILAAAVAVLMLVSCSADPEQPRGEATEELCGGFAEGESLAALESIVGEDVLTDRLSDREGTIRALRSPDGEVTVEEYASGSPYCRLWSERDSGQVLDIAFREALVIPESRDRAQFTYYASGRKAFSSDRLAMVYFECRLSGSKDFFLAAMLERSNRKREHVPGVRASQITLLNAAARAVSKDLNCQNDTKLVAGVPVPEAADGAPAPVKGSDRRG
ncbi:hypothetical protein [Streptomyces sp. NPDC047928]|uniref:hypothetical protein n=1 Tax=unclassified Streptomyces TaxID=2593676 RepID=UPI0037242C74